ncbi:MAG: DUF4252 domain-containing protein [Bacteroidales bacterium]|nr:DUF4252 domain-containing protein [Bacteroidales bacterium]
MKTNSIKTVLLIFILTPLMSMAQYQSPVEKLYTKYAGEDGFTSVNVSKELFQMIMKMEIDGEGTDNVKDIQNMMEQLDGLKVISYENKENPAKAQALYKEFSALFPSGTFTELMVVKEKGNNIRFLTKQDDKGKIRELVMLAEEEGEVTVLSLVGRIDMSTVSKLSKTMKIHGMDKLNKMDEKEEKKDK